MFVRSRVSSAETTTRHELSCKDGLPTTSLDEKISIPKRSSFLREIPKVIGCGIGAFIGGTVGATIGGILLIITSPLRGGENTSEGQLIATVGLTCMVAGPCIGAIAGERITACALNLICGRE